MSNSRTLTLDDLAQAVGTTIERVPGSLRTLIQKRDLRYVSLSQAERDQVILRVLQRLESGELSRVGEHRQNVWEKGWEENLEAFSAKGFALEALMPRFIRPEPILRFRKDYVRAHDARCEFYFHDAVRRWLFLEYMADAEGVFEFGCGSAYNLVACAELNPELRYVGLDWAESAVKLANLIGQKHQIRLTGRKFDLFRPDDTLDLGPRDVALTICSLEQVGARHEEFLQFLLRKRPLRCVHMEPLLDLYDPTHLVDHLAVRFHTLRGYLSGFLGRLKELEAEGKIEILRTQRMQFGSLFHEGYSYVVWRPL
jgi:SAM-dependent methyltransferase